MKLFRLLLSLEALFFLHYFKHKMQLPELERPFREIKIQPLDGNILGKESLS